MIPFLKSVAKAYMSRYADLSEFCFLFPNKRSGTFFLKYLQEECERRIILSPDVKSISEFVSELSGRVVASRLDLIFLLYETYRELLGVEEGEDSEGVSFDSFRGWGETVLSDFNEVDLYLVDSDEIFKNVKDFREIATNFLTEEQRRVMEEYFGRTDVGNPNEFWKNFEGEEERLSVAKKRFLHLWRIMSPLYAGLNRRLAERGLSTTGGSYRLALRRLEEKGVGILPYKKIVIVGFNALSTSENSIFTALRDADAYPGYDTYADFFWDATGPVLNSGVNSASKFVKANIKSFPCPAWALPALRRSDTLSLPQRLKVAASPSNSAQVKIVGTLLGELGGRLDQSEFKDAKVAVVLPDENLLLPMLYSLPQGMGNVNLTMGYSIKQTSVVPFVTLLRRMHHGMRARSGEKAFYHKDLRQFFSHPFVHACFSTETVNGINGYVDAHHKALVTLSEIRGFSAEMASVLDGPSSEASPEDVVGYLDSVLARVASSLPGNDDSMIKSRLEISHIDVYRDALRRMKELLRDYPVEMKPATVFLLIDRLIAGETVGFEGEPLTGLQVMGMLETRSIDFDYLFILSANERVLPMRARGRSFIPDTLRRAFGMPPSNYAESIFAYYFYRMISRAKEVTMVYDARTGGGLRSGDISRYILQLRHLFAKGHMKEEDWKFILSGKIPYDPSVAKTEEISERLEAYMNEDGGLNFSASSLNAYRECQVRFFFQSVMGISTDPEPTEYIDSIAAGNILHELMLELYVPEKLRRIYLAHPIEILPSMIDSLLQDRESLFKIVTRVVNRVHFRMDEESLDTPLSGGALIVGQQILRQAMSVLRHDRELAPFRIYGCEISEKLRISLPSGRTVNFKFAIDRLDEIEAGGSRRLRIVDYKTGRIKLDARDMDAVFEGGYESEQIFQLFTYAWLLGKRNGVEAVGDVRLEIYDVNKIHTGEERLPEIAGERVEGFGPYAESFSEGMETLLDGIFDNEEFKAPDDEAACVMCRLKSICRR
ncbi:MAG: PD-(D/E)XK nuclease family protein [Muribaculaceae bacterium]|nr:PD-(D/E)XK nuclease family protein [Muribaculaceae bacterium]